MRWNTGKYTIIEVHRAQELEPVEQPVRRGGVIARLNPAQPDEAADRPRQHLGSQSVEPITGDGIETGRDPLLDPTFGGDERVRAQPPDCRDRRQDRSEEHTSELQSLMR